MSNRFIDTIRENVKYPNSDGVYGNWDILNIGQRKFMIECADYMESMEHVIEQLFKEKQQREYGREICETCKNSEITRICKSGSKQCENYHPELEVDRLNIVNEILEAKYKKLKDTYAAIENDLINANLNLEHVTEELGQQQRWIPVSEKLPGNPNPEDGEPKAYLVTINKFAIVPTTLYYMGDGRWVREWDEPSEIYTNILAWRELPEPYKEGSHE